MLKVPSEIVNCFTPPVMMALQGAESDDMMDNSDEFSVESNLGSDESYLENESSGNAAWADVMSKVLNTKISKEKFILSKARKDSDIVKKAKQKHEIELVDESGAVKKTEGPKSKELKSYKALRKEMLEKQKQKAEWEAMCRVKPDVTQKEKERELVRIATRGVVHLFNTVEKHQKGKKTEKNIKRKESVGAVKGTFMDILKGQSKKQQSLEDDPVLKKAKQEETWNILKDDFMMGAEMKDWDKESDND